MDMPSNRQSTRPLGPLAALPALAVVAALLAAAPARDAVAADERPAAAPEPAKASVVHPAISHSRPPLYPVQARHFGQQGRVLVRTLVDVQGRPAQVEIKESSGHPLLDQAALDAVRLWSFTPGTRNATPEAMWTVVPISFSMEGKVHPTISRSRPPLYPLEARQLGQQGRVVVRALVDAQGRVAHAEVKESSNHPLLDQAALATVRGWAFTPGTRNGTPEAMWARIPINFSLDGKAGR